MPRKRKAIAKLVEEASTLLQKLVRLRSSDDLRNCPCFKCYDCNVNKRGNSAVFRERFTEEFGEECAEWLEANKRSDPPWTADDLPDIIESIKGAIKIQRERVL